MLARKLKIKQKFENSCIEEKMTDVASSKMEEKKIQIFRRDLKTEDLHFIAKFAQTPQELFFMFPAASYPLTFEQFKANTEKRIENSVFFIKDQEKTKIILDGTVNDKNCDRIDGCNVDEIIVGFANFYMKDEGLNGIYIGNLIVNPKYRNCGVGRFIVHTMSQIAQQEFPEKSLYLCCFNENVPGLKLYWKMNFKVVDILERLDWSGKQIVTFVMKHENNDQTSNHVGR